MIVLFAGQQVEVVELTSPELALVRLGEGASRPAGQPSEGLVPISCLKLSPLKALSQSAPRAAESEQGKKELLVRVDSFLKDRVKKRSAYKCLTIRHNILYRTKLGRIRAIRGVWRFQEK